MPAQGNPTPPLVGGNSAVGRIEQGYVFASGIHKPEHSSILTWKYPQYYVTHILDKLGASEPVAQDVFSWNVLDRTREGGTVAERGATGGATLTFEIPEFDFTADKPGYLIVGDVIRMQNGLNLRVTATDVSVTLTGKQRVTVEKVGGGVFGATDVANAHLFGHSHSLFGEGSEAPIGRLYLPTEEYNVLSILRRSINVTGSEITNRTWLGNGEAWYFTVEDIERKEFAKDRENLIMFGQLSDSGVKSTRGILDYVQDYGVVDGYAAAAGVDEADLIAHIQQLLIEGSSNELLVLCGAQFLADVQVALKDYALAGAINYGTFGDNSAGLDFRQYQFMGKKLTFMYYELFDDSEIVPFAGTATADIINFSNFSLWLDLGTDSSGKRLITLKYKELNGRARKFIQTFEPGMMSPSGASSGAVSSGYDGFKIHMLSNIGVEVRLPNRMGILRATS